MSITMACFKRAPKLSDATNAAGQNLAVVAEMKIPWNQEPGACRVSTIADGNCFFHAVLKATSEQYRNLITTIDRTNLARAWRGELAGNLEANWGLYDKQLELEMKSFDRDAMLKLLRSDKTVGEEVLYLAAIQANVNIHILELLDDGTFRPSAAVMVPQVNRHILVLQVDNHYELLVQQLSNKGYRFWFEADKDLMKGLGQWKLS